MWGEPAGDLQRWRGLLILAAGSVRRWEDWLGSKPPRPPCPLPEPGPGWGDQCHSRRDWLLGILLLLRGTVPLRPPSIWAEGGHGRCHAASPGLTPRRPPCQAGRWEAPSLHPPPTQTLSRVPPRSALLERAGRPQETQGREAPRELLPECHAFTPVSPRGKRRLDRGGSPQPPESTRGGQWGGCPDIQMVVKGRWCSDADQAVLRGRSLSTMSTATAKMSSTVGLQRAATDLMASRLSPEVVC